MRVSRSLIILLYLLTINSCLVCDLCTSRCVSGFCRASTRVSCAFCRCHIGLCSLFSRIPVFFLLVLAHIFVSKFYFVPSVRDRRRESSVVGEFKLSIYMVSLAWSHEKASAFFWSSVCVFGSLTVYPFAWGHVFVNV